MHEQTKAFCEADQEIIPHCGNPANSAEDLKISIWYVNLFWGILKYLVLSRTLWGKLCPRVIAFEGLEALQTIC